MATKKRLIDANELLRQMEQADADVFDRPPPGYCNLGGDDWGYSYDTIARVVQNMPTVDAMEVTHGRWLLAYKRQYASAYECSICRRTVTITCDEEIREKLVVKKYPFCHCGAKMNGGFCDGKG